MLFGPGKQEKGITPKKPSMGRTKEKKKIVEGLLLPIAHNTEEV